MDIKILSSVSAVTNKMSIKCQEVIKQAKMSTHNEIELRETGEPPKDIKNSVQFISRTPESQNLHGVHRVCQVG